MILLPGCKKEAEPEPQVTVQAEHPGAGTDRGTHQRRCDSVSVGAGGHCAQDQRAGQKVLCPARRARESKASCWRPLRTRTWPLRRRTTRAPTWRPRRRYATATKAQVPEDTQKAELDVAQARANLDLNRSIVKSRKQLFAEGAIPGRDLDTAEAALVQAQAAYDTAAKHLESLRQVSREAALKSAQGQLTSAEGKYMGAEAQLNYSEIRSPINGVVTDRPLYAGETAAAGAPLLTVMDTSALIAKDSPGAEPRAANEGGRRGLGSRARSGQSGHRPKCRSSVPRSTRAARRWKSGFASTTRPAR